jgi:hypothetical protein
VVLLTAFHFWFINHAERLLEELVESRSNGKLKLHVKNFRFNYFSNNMELRHAVFYSTDTTTASTAYRFNAEKINFRVKEVFPLIFEKKIIIDSIRLINPDIQVTRLRSVKDTSSIKDKDVSLPHEMGKVYKSIQDALEVLKVSRFQIDNGKFTLANKMQPDELPVTITNLYFHLDNLQVDTSKAAVNKKILFSDNVSLQTHNQNILFPDGRHRLSFSNFHINIVKKLVEFDSCTIAASKGDSAKSSFSVFFDKLLLTNIDFDTLYQKEIIKADSVYCTNPQFRLDVDLEKRKGGLRPPPKLNELIQQLTGDLQLEFVVVNNGSFNITTRRDGNPSSFTSANNNFEVQGLRIQKKSQSPLTVRSFAMAIRNYENFLKDSTYAMTFDSILLVNNSVYLSNFSFTQLLNKDIINSFSMPQFELRGLSWDDLVFERTLSAERATLYHPVINYSVVENKKLKKQNVFQVLEGIGNIIQLNNLDIEDGQINIHFKGGSQLQLENASMSVLSQRLVESDRIDNLQKSVSNLRFKKGLLKLGNLEARMENVAFIGNNGQLTGGSMYVTNKEKSIAATAKGVTVNNMQIDNRSYITEINGIQWQEADVRINGSPAIKKSIAPGFILKNIRGTNTQFTSSDATQKISAFFETLAADEFLPKPGAKPAITNLSVNGKNFSFTGKGLQLTAGRFRLADHLPSVVQDMILTNSTVTDSVSAVFPSIGFTPDLNAIINGSVTADNLSITHPLISLKSHSPDNMAAGRQTKLPFVSIGKISIQQPDITLDQPGHSGFTKIQWHSKNEKNNSAELTSFKIADGSNISADQILLSLHDFSFTANGKTFDAGNGEISARISNFSMKPGETGEKEWQGQISDMQAKDFSLDSLGRNSGILKIQSARVHNLTIGSAAILNFRQLVKENSALRFREITGKYDDAKKHLDWLNVSYDKPTKTLTADSFTFHPALSKEDFMAGQKYQSDYMTFRTGAISANSLDIDKYLADTIIYSGTVNIDHPVITGFRDKRVPQEPGIIKPLPVNLLKKIPAHLVIDVINLNNANIEYGELNEKTNQTGLVTLTRMNAKVSSVRTHDQQPGDSLDIYAQAFLQDSVRIQLHVRESYTDSLAGFLMTAGISPADVRVLNPLLIPLASVRAESGMLDTLYMQVTGKEYTAMGEMKMFYHDLKIKIFSTKGDTNKLRPRGFINFLANTLIKNNNSSRTGVVFFKRLRERSSLNYLVKITTSGAASSIGINKFRKQARKYKKEMRKHNPG